MDDLLLEVLLSQGVALRDITSTVQRGYCVFSIFLKDLKAINRLKRSMEELGLKKVKITKNILNDLDWQNSWKKEFVPFNLSDGYKVVPTWLKNKHKPRKRKAVFIDTSLAFGTGMHVTTRFMSQFIEKKTGQFDNFLDIGCGTGILTIVGLHCGAKSYKAVDITDDAVAIAKMNLIENGFAAKNVYNRNINIYKDKTKYDFVAANLITPDLVAFGDKIISKVKKGKYLAVSGISLSNHKWFVEQFKKYPLRCLNIKKGEGWVGILYKKL